MELHIKIHGLHFLVLGSHARNMFDNMPLANSSFIHLLFVFVLIGIPILSTLHFSLYIHILEFVAMMMNKHRCSTPSKT